MWSQRKGCSKMVESCVENSTLDENVWVTPTNPQKLKHGIYQRKCNTQVCDVTDDISIFILVAVWAAIQFLWRNNEQLYIFKT